MARTVGAKNKPKNEDGLDYDNTVIEGEDIPKKPRQKATGKVTVEKAIIADKLNVLCDGLASLMGYEYIFTAEDYNKEAVALANIAKLYPPVAKVLEFFDPLLIIFGIVQKFRGMKKKQKPTKQNQPPQNVPRETIPEQQNNSLQLLKMG